MRRQARKGVSPLIAAVLLIAFTMAVAAILTAWVTTFTQEQTETLSNESQEQLQCTSASLQIISTQFGSSSVDIAISNTGSRTFNNLSYTAFEGSTIVGTDFEERALDPGGSVSETISTDSAADSIRVQSRDCSNIVATQNK